MANFVLAVLILIAAFLTSPGEAALLDSVSYSSAGKNLSTSASSVPELEINSVLDIKVDNEKLSKAIIARMEIPGGMELLEDIKTIQQLLDAVPEAQKNLIAFKVAAVGVNQALAQQKILKERFDRDYERVRMLGRRAAPSDHAAIKNSKEAFDAANTALTAAFRERGNALSSFGNNASPLLRSVQPLKKKHPELYQQLNKAILGSYEDFIPVLTAFLKNLTEQLAKKVAESAYEVLFIANLQGEGTTAALHLDGYDQISIGQRTQFGRLQFALDDRAKWELQGAEQLGAVVNKLNDPIYLRQVSDEVKKMGDSFKNLSKSVGDRDLQSRLEKVVQASGLDTDPKITALMSEIKDITGQINSLVADLDNFHPNDIMELILFGGSIVEKVKKVSQQLTIAVTDIIQIETEVVPRLANSEQLKAVFVELRQRISAELPATTSTVSELEALYRTLINVRNLTSTAEETSRKAKSLGVKADLNTTLDLQSIKAPRYPGDEVIVTLIIFHNGQQVLKEAQRFQLEKIGLYWETRGALIFVDPVSNVKNLRPISFQPAPAVSFNMHYGCTGFTAAKFLNRDLDLGLGMSLALLDFIDRTDLEVGLGVNVTAFRGLIWGGFGRNLQAQSNYVYVGINPLALATLFQQQTKR